MVCYRTKLKGVRGVAPPHFRRSQCRGGKEKGTHEGAQAKPVNLEGEAHKYVEWKAEPLACLRVNVDRRIDGWAKCGQTQTEEVTEDAVDLENRDEVQQVGQFSPVFHPELTKCHVSAPSDAPQCTGGQLIGGIVVIDYERI